MKKKALSMILAAAMVAAMTAGCGSKAAEAPATEAGQAETTAVSEAQTEETKETGSEAAGDEGSADGDNTFIVGFDQEFPPMGFVGDDGEFTGFDLEMAAEAASRMGLK